MYTDIVSTLRWSFHLNDRHPSAWTCKSVQEMAHGNCDGVSGAWGDRFIEIGNWRIGVVDIIHLEVICQHVLFMFIQFCLVCVSV